MNDLPVLQATYSDLKTVKTRSVCQLILEMPIEALTDVVGLLGAPVPGSEVWVAVARLMTTEQLERGIGALSAPSAEPEERKAKPLSQVSAILCNIVAFRRFLHEQHGIDVIPSPEEAADWVREYCGVNSRREFDTDETAASSFRHLRAQYDLWMRVPA